MSSENVQAEAIAEGDLSPQLGSAVAVPRRSLSIDTLRDRPAINSLHCRKSIIAFKFGGTSLLGAERMLHAAGLVKPVARGSNVVVIVSAMKGVTDRLL